MDLITPTLNCTKLFVLCIVLFTLSFPVSAARTIQGTVLEADGKPAIGYRVRALDSDKNADDQMGEALTDERGHYKITYRKGSWDGKKKKYSTKWRPDVYIVVAIPKADGGWKQVDRTGIRKNHKVRNDITQDFRLPVSTNQTSSCTYKYEVEVWRKDAIFNGNTMDHTATRTKIHEHCGNVKKIFKIVDKCNHGACPATTGMERKHRLISKSETTSPLYPVGCDYFGIEYKVRSKPERLKNYGLDNHRHVCNNDTFMQMGQIVAGVMPDETTVRRVCRNKNYNDYTERDPKYMPSFDNVEAFISKWGWEEAVPVTGGGGGQRTNYGANPRHVK